MAKRIARWLALASVIVPAHVLAARAPETRAAPASVVVADRALPLRHFHWSRATGTDAEGYYHQPAGLSDDFPEGTTAQKIERDLTTAAETGAEVFRFGMAWDHIEKEPGRYDFHLWDQVIDAAVRHGVTPIPYLCYTPEWAATGAKDPWSQPPRDPSAFARFAAVVAERYRGVVHAWELWNEPDNEAYWRGTPDDFARMVTGAARQIRRVDPEAVVVLGGMAKGRGPFVDALVGRLGVDRTFDVVNVHGYLETWSRESAEGYPARVDAMAALLPPPGRGPDLWLAELGYSDHRVAPGEPGTYTHEVYAYEHTPEYQATSLIKDHVLALAPEKVSLTVWYRVDDLPATEEVIGDAHNRHLGVLDLGGNRKPSFYALRLYNRLFDRPARTLDARVQVTRPPGSQSEAHVFEKKDGGVLLFAWLRSPRQAEGTAPQAAVDDRRESISVALPGAGYGTMTVYDERGEVIPSTARLAGSVVEGVRLTGDRVFIAELGRRAEAR